jgi:Tol biopolymer transport system component
MKALEKILNIGKKVLGTSLLLGGLAFSSTSCGLFPLPNETGKIVFSTSDYYTDKKIWSVNVNGSNLTKISDNCDSDGEIDVSPNKENIAFISSSMNEDIDESSIPIITDLEGNIVKKVNEEWGSNDLSWTHDGNSLLLGGWSYIKRYDLIDSSAHILAGYDDYVLSHNPIMSPNSKKIAYTMHSWGNEYDNFVLDSDGENEEVIASSDNLGTTFFNEDLNLSWLDDETLIWKNANNDMIYHYNLNTKTVTEINPKINFDSMSLSPDKKTLAMYGFLDDMHFIETGELSSRTVNPKNTKIRASDIDWSPTADYFVVVNNAWNRNLKIYNKNLKEYRLLEHHELPKGDEIGDIKWVTD